VLLGYANQQKDSCRINTIGSYPFFYTVKEISMNDEINKIKISTLIILNTLSCRSSGISLTRHKEFVSLFMLKTVKTANKMK